jgi:hypothetical protein
MRLALVILAILVTSAMAQLPSDLLTYKNVTGTPVSLVGVSPESARAIDATNPGLVAFVGWNLPDLGRLCTIPREGAQGKATEGTAEQLTFLNEPVANLTSIGGNVSGEDVTEINGTLVWF